MANYLMYEDSVECTLKVDLLNLNLSYLFEDIIDEIDDALIGVDFVLNKYSWDGKKPYESTHQGIINDARENKAVLLLKQRELNKLIVK